jgi:diguanylate cyclase (GGDEF)-like protein
MARQRQLPAVTRPRTWLGVHALLLFGALALGWRFAYLDKWSFGTLAVIATFTIGSELTSVSSDVGQVWISGSFLGIVLTAVLLGGGAAALLGGTTIAVGWLRSREPGPEFRNNLVTFACFPLLTGTAFQLVVRHGHLVPASSVGYYLWVLGAFILALMLNFIGIATYNCIRDRVSFSSKVRSVLVPVLPAELFSAVLTVAAAFSAKSLGIAGLVMFGIVLVIFQYLVGELLTSQARSKKLQWIAATDELTGLANRERFREAVEQRIAAEGPNGRFALLLMDLDRFKEVNDTLGHHYGDVLLRDLGPRLVSAVGNGGLVARLGGDEFGILPADRFGDPGVLESIITRLSATVGQPFKVDELSLEVGSSIGVARYPQDGNDSHALLRCADIAMYAAKEAQTDYKLYAAEQNQHSVRRLNVLSDIRHALTADEIVVHYQPIVDLDDRTVTGAEGLVRWQHPRHGLIPPDAFVQTVEQTGLIGPLTRHVLEHAIAECAKWRHDGRDLSVAVNLSVRNLLDRDLPREIERMLDSYHVPAHALQLEITESMIMTDPERALATVSRLSGLGMRLSVDDFGTGYSSLANLRRLPIDELKIDRSFVSPMLQDESDLIIVRSTINLGHDLGLRIIAEGVEDGPTLERLAALGCDLAQGYHLSRPMPASAFSSWLDDSSFAGGPAASAGAGGPAPAVPAGNVKSGGLVLARPVG